MIDEQPVDAVGAQFALLEAGILLPGGHARISEVRHASHGARTGVRLVDALRCLDAGL